VLPVADDVVNNTLPHLNPTLRAMVEVQRLTGARPGEICRMCPSDIDEDEAVWLYRPATHKTAHLGRNRVIAIGPRAQAILERFRPLDPNAVFFSPRRAVEAYHAGRSENRVTPLYASHARRNAAVRVKTPRRKPRESYTVCAYGQGIRKGIEKANSLPGPVVLDIPHWHPNQLRHTFATKIRKEHGLEAAQVTLGHSKADVTQVYAERDLELATRVAKAAG
jgi:integrase